jgi:NitT/TauT family transport system substrate-binding protein
MRHSQKSEFCVQAAAAHILYSLVCYCAMRHALRRHLSQQAQAALDKVVLRINFTPWGMHAQYFGGRAQGFYKEEGIDLEIRPPSAGQQNEVFIATGREQFGVTNADAFVKAKGSGLPDRSCHGRPTRQSISL